MLLGEPPRTKYDLEFSLFGFPVRVHPLFFAVMGVLGLISSHEISGVAIWIAVGFVSILVHELGHAFAMRHYGSAARIVLHMMGGLAIPEGSWNVRAKRTSANAQIIISAAGPAAGFLLAAAVVGAIKLSGGEFIMHFKSIIFWTFALPTQNPLLWQLVQVTLFVNILWGLMNLLPVYPLDGGQISREMFTKYDAWNGVRNSLMLSTFTGAGIAIWGLLGGSIFLAVLFGSLAYQSWQAAQNMGSGGGFGGGSGGGGYGRGGRPW